MSKILPAILDALSTAAGPLGFPGKFVLRLYDDKKAEEREAKLKAMIMEDHSISQGAIEEIYEIRNEMNVLREQLVKGIIGIKEILSKNKKLLATPQFIETELSGLINKYPMVLQDTGFVTEKMLVNELSDGYAHNPNGFIQTLDLGGFDIASIPFGQDNVLRTTVFRFLKVCRVKYTLDQQEKIFSALAEENPNSESLRVYAALLKERINLE